MSSPTQVRRPWRTMVRSAFQFVVGAAAVAPVAYEAATQHQVAEATGWAATGLGIAAAITRVMALPIVDDFLAVFLPFLATQPGGSSGDKVSIYQRILGKA